MSIILNKLTDVLKLYFKKFNLAAKDWIDFIFISRIINNKVVSKYFYMTLRLC